MTAGWKVVLIVGSIVVLNAVGLLSWYLTGDRSAPYMLFAGLLAGHEVGKRLYQRSE